jgi:hypothetical protein
MTSPYKHRHHLRPGLWSVNRSWRSASGVAWELNQHVLVLDTSDPDACICSTPSARALGLHFVLTARRLRSNFAYVGPLSH